MKNQIYLVNKVKKSNINTSPVHSCKYMNALMNALNE